MNNINKTWQAGPLYIVSQLVFKDLLLFFRGFLDKVIDLSIMLGLNVIVFGYFMPGVRPDFGVFILIGAIASFGFFEIVGKVGQLVADIDGDRTINYKLILPLSSTLVFCSQAIAWALESTIINIILFPLGKILLFSQFDLTKIAYVKLCLMIMATNLFYGFFALWVTSMLRGGIRSLSHLWIRFISPLYMFGCYFYSWQTAYNLSPAIGYISFLNPFVFIMEGTRSAVLGAESFLPFWYSFAALIGFIVFFGWHGIKRLKVKLDCI
ncbi:MAG: hypothetical protein NT124_02775 [Candidatus Dependentiae bacterium]|nr:hypothetical protein [Candidatus Dependentiae bacterium]